MKSGNREQAVERGRNTRICTAIVCWAAMTNLCLGGAPAPRGVPAQAAEGASIEGVVADAVSNEGLRKARLTLTRLSTGSNESAVAATDGSGRFQFTGLAPGRYRISVERNGFVRSSAAVPSSRAPRTVAVAGGEHIKDLLYLLVPAAAVAGRVSDQDGDAVPGVRIQLLRRQYSPSSEEIPTVGFAVTDDRGQYRIAGLRAGRYFVRASSPNQAPASRTSFESPAAALGYAPVYYPGVADAARAVEIRLAEGEERNGIDLALVPAHTVTVRGRILDAAGQPIRDASVFLTPRGTTGLAMLDRKEANIDDAGFYELRNVSSGSYKLLGHWTKGGMHFGQRQIEAGDANLEDVNLVLRPAIAIKGKVEVEGGSRTALSRAGIQVALRAKDSSSLFMGEPTAAVRADGGFELDNLGADEYRLILYGIPANCYARAVRLGDQELPPSGFSLGDESRGATLIVILSPKAAAIAGSVRAVDGKPAAGVTVVLAPEQRGQVDLYRDTKTDESGRFAMQGIPPGDYKLFAWEQVEWGSWFDSAFLESSGSKGKPIRLGEAGQTAVELEVVQKAAAIKDLLLLGSGCFKPVESSSAYSDETAPFRPVGKSQCPSQFLLTGFQGTTPRFR